MFKFVLFTLVLVMSSCSIFSKKISKSRNLIVNKDATIVMGDEEREVKKDESLEMPTESFILRAKGNIPVYVVPLRSKFKDVKVSLNEFENAELTTTIKNKLNSTLSESLFEIHDIQNEIFKKQYNRALTLIENAEKKYGRLSFLTYTKASVYYLRGNRTQAKQLLQSVKEEGRSKEQVENFLREIE